jgi:hypothetical protein
MRIGANEYAQLDVTGPMTLEEAKREIVKLVQAGKGTFGQFSWRDAESEPVYT